MKKHFVLTFLSMIVFLWPGVFAQVSAGEADELNSLLSQPDKRIEIYSGEQPPDISQMVQKILSKPLSVNEAVQVFLLNSPDVQVTLQDLKISRADRLQNRLLPNPHVEATFHQGRLHETGENSTHQEYKFSQDLNSILLYPLKWRVSGAQYDEAKMRVAEKLQSQIADVKKTFFHLQALQQKKFAITRIMHGIDAATELAKRQRAAGTLNALDLAGQETLFYETTLLLDRTDTEMETTRIEMQKRLGLGQSSIVWQVQDELPKISTNELDLSQLESLTLSKRPELLASRSELKALDRQVTLEFLNIIPSVQGGILWEKEDDFKSFGPYGQIEIPLTDWNQAAIWKARSKKRQGKNRLETLESQALTDVRALHKRMVTARKAAQHYEKSILPLRVQIVEESQKHYNFMLSGVYQLLQAKQNEIAAFQNYIDVVEDYWVTRTELESNWWCLPVASEIMRIMENK